MKIWREKETLAIEPKTEWSNASGNSELDVLIAAKTRRQDQTWPAFCFPDFLVLQFRVAEIPSNFIRIRIQANNNTLLLFIHLCKPWLAHSGIRIRSK
jgi:hypothetical protein